MLQKQGKKLRREGKDKWIDFTDKVSSQLYSGLDVISKQYAHL